jgi:two-component system response regulator RegX3
VLPDLIILEDFNAQDEELELCQKLRAETAVPILYLTSKTGEAFFLKTYKTGADECIPLPISPRLFQAKVSAWLRRTQSMPMTALDEVAGGGFRLNPGQRRLATPDGEVLRLTILESRLLFLLMSHAGRVFETETLVERVWGSYGSGDSVLLKNLVYRLRRKIEPDPGSPRYLLTEASQGYKFVGEVPPGSPA